MTTPDDKAAKKKSAFALGLKASIESIKEEIQELYLSDSVPWIIGYSGGKDSSAVLQLTWLALKALPVDQRKKTVHVITTDTMVENPVVSDWVQKSLETLEKTALAQTMPFQPRMLRPSVEESFWVNLIGKGYPAPRPKFRWCTERLKIKPSNRFIREIVTDNGEAILLIGARKAESSARARVLSRNTKYRVRDRLSPSATLAGCSIYTPIEDWTNDDVWMFLMQIGNPWGISNKDLLNMYQGASVDGECPLVLDSSTPSCGDSRFGCWVCTLVDKDKSMTAMIQNDQEKEWMMPLLELRNALDFRSGQGTSEDQKDHHLRDFRRMNGAVQLFQDGRPIPGPYTQSARENWLRKLLEAQTWIRQHGPQHVREIQLITLEELQEIRRLWVIEKHEMEDSLPRIFHEVTGTSYPGPRLDDNLVFGSAEMELLSEAAGDDRIHFELTRELLSVERQLKSHTRRANAFDQLEKAIGRHYYEDKADATDMAQRYSKARRDAENGLRMPAISENQRLEEFE